MADVIKDKRCELEKLNMEGNQMGNKSLYIVTTALEEVKYIQSLNISKNKITCLGAKAIGSLL